MWAKMPAQMTQNTEIFLLISIPILALAIAPRMEGFSLSGLLS